MTPSVGQEAPAWQATDQSGASHTSDEYRGRWLVLYFYPKDDTPGCTKEACSFRDAAEELPEEVAVVGVSGDSEASHQRFAEKYRLPFTLLADLEKKIIGAYGTDGVSLPKRTTFLIDPHGRIAKIYEKVAPAEHAAVVIQDLKKLGAA